MSNFKTLELVGCVVKFDNTEEVSEVIKNNVLPDSLFKTLKQNKHVTEYVLYSGFISATDMILLLNNTDASITTVIDSTSKDDRVTVLFDFKSKS